MVLGSLDPSFWRVELADHESIQLYHCLSNLTPKHSTVTDNPGQTSVFTDCGALMTQLIFDHALRIRVKAETTKGNTDPQATGTGSTTAVATPDNASAAEPEEDTASTPTPENETSTQGTKKPEEGKDKAPVEGEKKDDKKSNLAGKLNNLITSDLDGLQGGQMFMMLRELLWSN